MPRRIGDARIEQLEGLLKAHWNDEPSLQELLNSIEGRLEQDVRQLRGKILRQLGNLQSTARDRETKASGPTLRMRPPGTEGLPPPPQEPTTARSEPGQHSNVSRSERYIAALQALITEQRASPRRKRRELRNGERSRKAATTTIYTFEFATQSGISDGANIDLEIPGQRVAGTVLSLQPGLLILSLTEDLGERIEHAILLLDDTQLLKELCDKLRAVTGGEIKLNTPLAEAALDSTDTQQPIAPIPDGGPLLPLNESQAEARRRVLNQSITFIWGPPGCGKTFTLGDVVRTVFEAGKRILICSNTNKAVDQLLLGVCRALGADHRALREGRIVRLGEIADDKLNAEFGEHIGLDAIIAHRSAALEQRLTELSYHRSALQHEMRELDRLVDRFHSRDNTEAELTRLRQEILSCDSDRADLRVQQAKSELRDEDLVRKLRRAERPLGVVFGNPERIRASIADEAQRRTSIEARRLEVSDRLSALTHQETQLTLKRDLLEEGLRGIDRDAVTKQLAATRKLDADMADEIGALQREIAGLAAAVVADALVLGSTGARAYLSIEQIGPVDLVIVDEASMMLLPLVWFVAGMSKERVVLCGDFRQLPPIIQSENEAVLAVIGGDVFHAAGVSALDPRDRRIVMLDTQRRMDKAICALISGPMYAGRLRTATDEAFRTERASRMRPPPPFERALTLIDTSDLHPLEAFDDSGSRYNMMHALLVRNIAWHLAQHGYIKGREDLAVCTPYAAQTKLIKKLLEGESLTDVQVGTVHAFQGDERNAIVLESPESEGRPKLGRFVTGVPPDDTGARLINVAVSRAQNHLIVIANLSHLDRLLPSYALLRSVLHQIEMSGDVVPAKQLLALGPLEKDLQGLNDLELSDATRRWGLFKEHEFDRAFAADIGRARQAVAIFSGFVSHNRVAELSGLLGDKIQSGLKVRCISKPPHRNIPSRPEVGQKAFDALESIGCAVDGREWIHEKVIVIDGRIVWQGSLNPLSWSQRSEELMVRLVNPEFARLVAATLAKLPISFSEVLEKIAHPENPRCGNCNSRTYYQIQRKIAQFTCENRCGWTIALSALSPTDANTPDAQPEFDELPPVGRACPRCGAQTLKRRSRFGTFYGCSRYPKCQGKWNLRDMQPLT